MRVQKAGTSVAETPDMLSQQTALQLIVTTLAVLQTNSTRTRTRGIPAATGPVLLPVQTSSTGTRARGTPAATGHVLFPVQTSSTRVRTRGTPAATVPVQICRLPECHCQSRKRHSATAVCRCTGKMLRLGAAHFSNGNVTELSVLGTQHCKGIIVEEHAFRGSSVKRVNISAPAKLVIRPRGFHINMKRTSFSLYIEGVKELRMDAHAFSGRISRISVTNVTSAFSIGSKAFVGVVGDGDIEFRQVVISQLESAAFSSVQLHSLAFSDSQIGRVFAGAVRDSQLYQLHIASCQLQLLEADAVQARVHQLLVTDSDVGEVRPDALQVQLVGTARLVGNTFHQLADGALAAIQPASGTARIEFHNNTLVVAEEGGLRFSSQLRPEQLALSGLASGRSCSCALLHWLQTRAGRQPLAERLAAVTSCCTGTASTPIGRYLRDECPVPSADDRSGSSDGTGGDGAGGGDGRRGRRRAAVLAGGAVAVLFFTSCVTGLVCWRLGRRRRKHRQQRHRAEANVLSHRPHKLNNANMFGGDVDQQRASRTSPAPVQRSPLVVAVPDVKTYTETELHVVLETLEPLCPHTPPAGDRYPESSDHSTEPGCRKSCPL